MTIGLSTGCADKRGEKKGADNVSERSNPTNRRAREIAERYRKHSSERATKRSRQRYLMCWRQGIRYLQSIVLENKTYPHALVVRCSNRTRPNKLDNPLTRQHDNMALMIRRDRTRRSSTFARGQFAMHVDEATIRSIESSRLHC